MHDKKLYGTATVGTKGQVVIPADAREALGIETGDRLYVVGMGKSKTLCFLQEEELRSLLDSLTDHVETMRGVLDKTNSQE